MLTLLKFVYICSLMMCAFAEEKKDDNKKKAESRSWTVDEPWRPLAWNPYNRQPLYTWWAAPWTAPHHHEALYHEHPILHYDPHHHLEVIPGPIGPHPIPARVPHIVPARIPHLLPAPVPHAIPAPIPHALPAPIPHAVPAPISHAIHAPVPHAVPAPISHAVHAPVPHAVPGPHHHEAKYVAQTLGSVHVAPLLGHTDSVVSTNLHPAPGRLLK